MAAIFQFENSGNRSNHDKVVAVGESGSSMAFDGGQIDGWLGDFLVEWESILQPILRSQRAFVKLFCILFKHDQFEDHFDGNSVQLTDMLQRQVLAKWIELLDGSCQYVGNRCGWVKEIL